MLIGCFKEQRYKLFESNSQLVSRYKMAQFVVSKSKDTSYLKAIHNSLTSVPGVFTVVSKSKDTSYLKAIHNSFEAEVDHRHVVSKSKDTSYLKAIHNAQYGVVTDSLLFQRAKIQVI